MIRSKKIRGHKRIWKNIDYWIQNSKQLDLDYLKNYQRDYSKIWVRPYSNLDLGNSFTPVPKGKTRQKIVDGLFEIHANWKQQLDTLNATYYLKIWFYHPDVSKSQVVCAIGDYINFYNITFHNTNENKPFPFGSRNLNWEHRIHEDHFDEDDLFGEIEDWATVDDFLENKKWMTRKLKGSHRITKDKQENGTIKTHYSFKTSDIWLGSSN